jgi:hypothetical protein
VTATTIFLPALVTTLGLALELSSLRKLGFIWVWGAGVLWVGLGFTLLLVIAPVPLTVGMVTLLSAMLLSLKL